MASLEPVFTTLVVLVLFGIVWAVIKSAASSQRDGADEGDDSGDENTPIQIQEPWTTQIGAGSPRTVELEGDAFSGNTDDIWHHIQVDYQNKIDMIYIFIEDLKEKKVLTDDKLAKVNALFSKMESDMNGVGWVNDWYPMDRVDKGIWSITEQLSSDLAGSSESFNGLKALQEDLATADRFIAREIEALNKAITSQDSIEGDEDEGSGSGEGNGWQDLIDAYARKVSIMESMIEEAAKKVDAPGRSPLRLEALRPKVKSIRERIEKARTEEDLRMIDTEMLSAATGIRLAVATYPELRSDADIQALQKDLLEADKGVSAAMYAWKAKASTPKHDNLT